MTSSSIDNISSQDVFPRRYCTDEEGKHVLVGLSPEETREFESLESRSNAAPVMNSDHQRDDASRLPDAGNERWLELYSKHDVAWRQWRDEHNPFSLADVNGVEEFDSSKSRIHNASSTEAELHRNKRSIESAPTPLRTPASGREENSKPWRLDRGLYAMRPGDIYPRKILQ